MSVQGPDASGSSSKPSKPFMCPFLSKFVSACAVQKSRGACSRTLIAGLGGDRQENRLNAIELETRVLYSATPLGLEASHVEDVNSSLNVSTLEEVFDTDSLSEFGLGFSFSEEAGNGTEFVLDGSAMQDSSTPLSFPDDQVAQQLVFIDANLSFGELSRWYL